MSNTNRTKPDATNTSRRNSNNPDAGTVPAAPATEAELEAIRYRGAPLLRAGPPAAANHNPISPVTPDGKNECAQAGNQAETEKIAKEQATPPRLS
jgi:hypothetical protein